jgi:hypothetical protein
MNMNNKLIAQETGIDDAQEINQVNHLDNDIALEASYISDITKRAFKDVIPDFKDFTLIYKGTSFNL